MSLDIDQANEVINDQEDAIAELKDKLLAMEDERDLAIGKALELVNAFRRIECAMSEYEDSQIILGIVKDAIDAYQAK